ncbi:hypothetical protein AC579_4284 [Pseudocercospora musae]|uniref:Uncharacterized protein n=1 Tax=Pseudocercospora musae TaxID=113226 RepID=A0A139IAR0_9PEZI|nr:hypothetical protein AC579_4284 [Pseudocercospora musae]
MEQVNVLPGVIMANGKRNKITIAGKATRENRMVLFMLFQIFDFSDSGDETVRQQLATIFIALYGDFKEYNFYNLYDRNVQRLKSGHQNADWKAIDRPNEWNNTTWDASELAHFATLRSNILREAAQLGIPIAYKTNPERKHRPLIPGGAAAPAAFTAAPVTQGPAHVQHPLGQPTSLHPTASATAAVPSQPLPTRSVSKHPISRSTDFQSVEEPQSNEHDSEVSDFEGSSRDYSQHANRIHKEASTDEANGDDSEPDGDDNITWSDSFHPHEADSEPADPNNRHRSQLMDSFDDPEDEDMEDLPSEDDSVDEDITWTDRNTVRGRLARDELQERAIACMNAAREAEHPEETVYSREAGSYLTPSWAVTEEMVQEEMKKLRDRGEHENAEVSEGQASRGSLFSGELEMLNAEIGETDVDRMLAHFAEN